MAPFSGRVGSLIEAAVKEVNKLNPYIFQIMDTVQRMNSFFRPVVDRKRHDVYKNVRKM